MNWVIEYLPEALDDLRDLDTSIRPQILKGIYKVNQNPLPKYKGGYGKPLGISSEINLSGLMKIKFKKVGIRVVYKTEFSDKDNIMKIIIISARADNQVYKEAEKRRKKYNL